MGIIKHLYGFPNIILLNVSCLLCAIYWRRLPTAFKWVGVFLWFSFFIEVSAVISGKLWHNNRPFMHLLTIGEFWIWSFFYQQIFGKSSFAHRHFRWILGLGTLVIVGNSTLIQSIWTSNTYSKTCVQLLVIWYAVAFAFHFAEQPPQKIKENKLLRLVNAAILIYYCGSLFIFMSGFAIGSEIFKALLMMNVILNSVFQILVLYALWTVIFKHPNSCSSSASPS